MKTTLNEIWSYFPCVDRWNYGLQHADPLPADDEPFELTRVLDVNGVDDTLWLLSEMGEQQLLVRFACDCAGRAVERYWEPEYPDDRRPQEAIEAARRWLAEPTEENHAKADAAARAADAAQAAVEDAEKAAASRAAAYAARAAYYTARGASARGAVVAAAEEREWQVAHLRKLLGEAE